VDWLECLREGLTYGAPLYVTFLLKRKRGQKEEKVLWAELTLRPAKALLSFNGAERVIVSPNYIVPLVWLSKATQHPNGKILHSSASSRSRSCMKRNLLTALDIRLSGSQNSAAGNF